MGMSGVTIRIDGDSLVATYDDGTTRRGEVPAVLTAALGRVAALPSVNAGEPTAGLLGTLRESLIAQPSGAGSSESRPGTLRASQSTFVGLPTWGPASHRTLLELLQDRTSSRSGSPIDLAALGALLKHSARVRDMWPAMDGTQESTRPAPSAGARHPIRVYALASAVYGLQRGLWEFDPFSCSLGRVAADAERIKGAARSVREALRSDQDPAAVLYLVADFTLTLSRYPTGGALVWRDAGVLIGTMHLVAEDLNLRSCIVGTTGALYPELDHREVDIVALAVSGAG